MPSLTFETRDSCALCGCRLRGFLTGTFRVNKNSLRSRAGSLSWAECPECGPAYATRNPLGVQPYCNRWQLKPESQAVVDAARQKLEAKR